MKDKFPRKALCINCGKYRRYSVGIRSTAMEYKKQTVVYNEYIGFCRKCKKEIDVTGLWDKNLQNIQKAYQQVLDKEI